MFKVLNPTVAVEDYMMLLIIQSYEHFNSEFAFFFYIQLAKELLKIYFFYG